jgi:hypothetical protein
MEQFDFQGTESNKLGSDIYRRVHFGDLPSQVIAVFHRESETLAIETNRSVEVGDAES